MKQVEFERALAKASEKHATIGDTYRPAMYIRNQKQANIWFQMLVARCVCFFGQTEEEATQIQKSNLGYYAGYFSDSTRRRVERLFKCAHPIFGAIKDKGAPSSTEAYRLGSEMAKKA